jgi:hypothetical protein
MGLALCSTGAFLDALMMVALNLLRKHKLHEGHGWCCATGFFGRTKKKKQSVLCDFRLCRSLFVSIDLLPCSC